MKGRIIRYFKHLSITFIGLLLIAIVVGLSIGATVHYGDHPAQYQMVQEGPYVFYESDTIISISYIDGSRPTGYSLNQEVHSTESAVKADCFFPLDSTSFGIDITHHFEVPEVVYADEYPVLAISDIESGFKTFRDFLISHEVINEQLDWIFGQGHLVLVGDFVDRGNSATQVLWFIYRLEQEAKKQGGQVHFIIGNHELKNFQGDYASASEKYYRVASVLERKPQELYSSQSFLGRWLKSKNAVESINGVLFVHGGLHPDLAQSDLSLEDIASIIRANYDKIYYPRPNENIRQQLLSNNLGPCWYRGYFKDDLSQTSIDKLLQKFNAKAIVVGHTLQSEVNSSYNGKVIGIDVQHPKDYHKNWPAPRSEGLFIEDDRPYRALDTGEKLPL